MGLNARQREIKGLIEAIGHPHFPGMFNPWSEVSEMDLDREGYLLRQERLYQHWSVSKPQLVLIGEAAGYQGCRFSGIPFTSERLILEGRIPRISGDLAKRISSRERPWSEPSATIVWKTLDALKITESTVLFNTVPWHPEGDKGPLSNRTPKVPEKKAGEVYLRRFLALFPEVPVAALGNIASKALADLGITHHPVRHPAYGGATKFREGLHALLNTVKERSMTL